MKPTRVLAMAAAMASLCGCVTTDGVTAQANESLPEGFRLNLVTARDAAIGRGALGVADAFSMNGKVVAFASFTWSALDYKWGRQKIEFLWYNGDRLVRRSESEHTFGHPPFFVWSNTYPTALGEGNCRVEVRWHGQKLGQRSFRVVDSTAPELQPPAGLQPTQFVGGR